MRRPPWIVPLISFLAGLGFEVSSIESTSLSILLFGGSGLLAVWWAWPYIARIRIRFSVAAPGGSGHTATPIAQHGPSVATLAVTAHCPGNGWAHLRVKNDGLRGNFTVKVLYIAWPVSSRQWYCAKWREQPPDQEARTLRASDQAEVDIAHVLTADEVWDELDATQQAGYGMYWRRVRFYSTSARPDHYFDWDTSRLDAEVMMDIAIFDDDRIVRREWYVLRLRHRRDSDGGGHGDLQLEPYSSINA
jgi:hypothetical protein